MPLSNIHTWLDSPFYKYHWVSFDVNHAPPKKEKSMRKQTLLFFILLPERNHKPE